MSNSAARLLNIFRTLAHSALPQACALCAAPCDDALCPACRADLPALEAQRCPVCALPVPGGGVCGACLKRAPAFDACVAAWRYEFPADRLVTALKYGRRLALAPLLGEALRREVAAAGEALPELVIPMPIARSRLTERGFNQALEIARPLAAGLGLPLAADAAERIADGPPQASLPWDERARNVRGAFACHLPLAGRHVAVVDDVLTTGATMGELAATLKRSGAARVSAWVVARTLRREG